MNSNNTFDSHVLPDYLLLDPMTWTGGLRRAPALLYPRSYFILGKLFGAPPVLTVQHFYVCRAQHPRIYVRIYAVG